MSVLIKLKFTNKDCGPVFIRLNLTGYSHDVRILSAYYEVARFCEQFYLTDYVFTEEEVAFIQESIESQFFNGSFVGIKELMRYFGKSTLESFICSF